MKGKRREYKLTNAIDRVDRDISAILSKNQSTRYFEGIVLMYSLIENTLKWLVYVKILWEKSDGTLRGGEVNSLKDFCNQQDFHSSLNLALITGLIPHPLFSKIDKIRKERNDLVHQAYLFVHRRNRRVLRAKLERIVKVADALFVLFNNLIEETGADDFYDIFTVRRKRQLIV